MDAPKAVIDAIPERGGRVLPATRCGPAASAQGDMREIAYNLSGFKRYGGIAAEIEGTTYAGHLATSDTSFDLELVAGEWKVSKQSLSWISQRRVLPRIAKNA